MSMSSTVTVFHSKQSAAWGKIHADHKHTTADGERMVLVNIDGATCLVTWFGPKFA